MPACPPRTTSASASITRTVSPQPDAHEGHTLGFHTAWPGTMSSSGTKRISVFSGLPQLASAALVPEIAVSLMKERRSISLLNPVMRNAKCEMQNETSYRALRYDSAFFLLHLAFELHAVSKVTRETVSRGFVLTVTRDAEAHVQIDIALRHRLLPDVSVTGRALDLGANVRRVVELHVRLLRV